MLSACRHFAKQEAKRLFSSSSVAAPVAKSSSAAVVPIAGTVALLVAATMPTPIASCEDIGVVSMDALTAEWDSFMKSSCILGEDDDDDEDEDDEDEDEEDDEEEVEEEVAKVEDEEATELNEVATDVVNAEETVVDDELQLASDELKKKDATLNFKKHWTKAMFKGDGKDDE